RVAAPTVRLRRHLHRAVGAVVEWRADVDARIRCAQPEALGALGDRERVEAGLHARPLPVVANDDAALLGVDSRDEPDGERLAIGMAQRAIAAAVPARLGQELSRPPWIVRILGDHRIDTSE